MKRFRLSTLLLLIVIAALSLALVMQERRAAQREAELQFRNAVSEHLRDQIEIRVHQAKIHLDDASLRALDDQIKSGNDAKR
jgi:hypothetical protein